MGILDTLKNAHTLREIADSSPLGTFGTYRLLIAILHWLRPQSNVSEWRDIWKNGCFPPELWGCEERANGMFELFSAKKPFYQKTEADYHERRREVKRTKREEKNSGKATTGKKPPKDPQPDEPKTTAYVVIGFPTGTVINHFRHLYDDAVLCPACAAKGLLTLPPFCVGFGSGNFSSINNAPPLYFLVAGDNLFQTLMLNLPTDEVRDDRPAWLRSPERPQGSSPIGPLEGLTWQPRDVHLVHTIEQDGLCEVCGGRSNPSIRAAFFTAGRNKHKDKHEKDRKWTDPHVALVAAKGKREAQPIRLSEDVAGWRTAIRVLLARSPNEQGSPPTWIASNTRLKELAPPKRQATECFFLCADQAAYRLMGRSDCGLAPWLMSDPVRAVLFDAILFTDEFVSKLGQLRPNTERKARNPKAKKPKKAKADAVAANLALGQVHFERRAETEFRKLVAAVERDPERHDELEKQWRQNLQEVAREAFAPVSPHIAWPLGFVGQMEAENRFEADIVAATKAAARAVDKRAVQS